MYNMIFNFIYMSSCPNLVSIALFGRFESLTKHMESCIPGPKGQVSIQNLVQNHLEKARLVIKRELCKVHGAAQGDVRKGLCVDVESLFRCVQLQYVHGAHLSLLQMFDKGNWLPDFRQRAQRCRTSCHLDNIQVKLVKFPDILGLLSLIKYWTAQFLSLDKGNKYLIFAGQPKISPTKDQTYLKSHMMMFGVHFLDIVHIESCPDDLVRGILLIGRVKFKEVVFLNTDPSEASVPLHGAHLW